MVPPFTHHPVWNNRAAVFNGKTADVLELLRVVVPQGSGGSPRESDEEALLAV